MISIIVLKRNVDVFSGKKVGKDYVLEMGNFNDAPSSDLLNKMLRDNRKEYDLDPDCFKFMFKLKQQYIDQYEDAKIVRGYILQ